MKKFIATIIKRPVTICMVVLILLVAGIFATTDMPVNLLPNMNMPFIGVSIVYPGASASAVEDEVTTKLEDELRSISGVVTASTYSMDNASVAVITFDYGTDLDKKISEVNSKLAAMSLPSGCQVPQIITIDLNAEAVATVALYREDEDASKILDDAISLQKQLYAIEGVGTVDLVGAPTKNVEITGIRGLDLSTLLIIQALSSEGMDIPLGTIMEDGEVVSLRNVSDVKTLEDVKNLPVKLSLPVSFLEVGTQVKELIKSFELLKISEYNGIVIVANELHNNIADIDNASVSNLTTRLDLLTKVNAVISILENNDYASLEALKEVALKVKEDVDSSSTKKQLEMACDKYNLSYPVIKFIAQINGEGNLNRYWESLLAFKSAFPNEVTNEDYKIILKSVEHDIDGIKIKGLGIIPSLLLEKEVDLLISSCDSIDLEVYEEIIETKKTTKPTDEQYSRLFKTFSLNEVLISFLRRTTYAQDLKLITDIKHKYVNSLGNPIDLNGEDVDLENPPEIIISNKDVLQIVNALNLTSSFNFEATEELLQFLRTVDESKAEVIGDNATLILPLEKISNISYVDSYSSYAKFNGHVSIMVEVHAIAGANTTAVVEETKAILQNNDYTTEIVLTQDKSQFINDSISNIITSIIIGGVLAVIIIFLFTMKIRSAIVISITMPLSVLATLICLWGLGITLNMVSLGGLAVGIGMLVDNSIVVLESITKRRDEGEKVFDSCVSGTKEVAGSLLASTLTNICVFFPILFIEGMTKEIFNDLVYSVVFSISISLIVALTVIPTLYHLLYRSSDKAKEPQKSGKLLAKAENKYRNILDKVLKHKLVVCIVALVVFCSSILLVFTTGTEFLPSVDQRTVDVTLGYDASTTLDEANQYTLEFLEKIDSLEDIEQISLKVNKTSVLTASISGSMRIKLKDSSNPTEDFARTVRQIGRTFDKGTVTVKEIDGVVAEVTSGFANMSCSIQGDSFEQLAEISQEIRTELEKSKYIVGTTDDISGDVNEYRYTIDKTKCMEYGVEYTNVIALLRAGIAGYVAATISIDDEEVDVNVSFSEKSSLTIANINNLLIGFKDGKTVILADVLAKEPEMVSTKVLIKKVDGQYQTTITIESDGADTGTITNEVKQITDRVLANYPDYQYVESGISSYLSDAFSGLVVALIIAFFLLFAVMACQFESFIKPLIVIVSIPLAFTGGFLALFITGTSLNVVSFIGIIMLMGVIVNNAIIMIDKINLLVSEGMTPYQAVLKGCSSRLRAILMTTLTTILALLPLSLGLGSGGELMQPMGIVVFGGLLLGTFVTLILIPCFYCIVKKIKKEENISNEE